MRFSFFKVRPLFGLSNFVDVCLFVVVVLLHWKDQELKQSEPKFSTKKRK